MTDPRITDERLAELTSRAAFTFHREIRSMAVELTAARQSAKAEAGLVEVLSDAKIEMAASQNFGSNGWMRQGFIVGARFVRDHILAAHHRATDAQAEEVGGDGGRGCSEPRLGCSGELTCPTT